MPFNFALSGLAVTALMTAAAPRALADPPAAGKSATVPELEYTIELLPSQPQAVRVTLAARAPERGDCVLSAQPHWGGVEQVEQEIHDLRVAGADGRPLDIAADPRQPHHFRLDGAKPSEPLRAQWELRQAKDDRLAAGGNVYRPVLCDDLIHWIGEVGLILPDWIDAEAPAAIRLSWRNFDQPGWSVVSSFGVGTEPRTLHMSPSAFRHGIFLAGRVRIENRDIRGGRLAVALYGSDWSFSDAAFADLVERIVRIEREFFNDFGDPFFLVTLVPSGGAKAGSMSLGGTGLTNAFALFSLPNLSLSEDSPWRDRMLHLLAHEYFHHWNGERIKRQEPEELLYWFSEGFTDFYAARLLYNAGLLTAEQWLARTNDDLREYWLSPVRNASAERIQQDFWKQDAVRDQPYKRGSAVALALDWEIRKRTNGGKSLDDFMRELLASADAGEKVSQENLAARIAAWTDADFARRLRAVVEQGATLSLPPELLSPALALAQCEAARFAPGFDIDASVKSRRISGVEKDSAAARAGLSDGQEILGMSIHSGDVTKPIKLTVRDAAGKRDVEFLPRGETMRTPCLRMNSAPKF